MKIRVAMLAALTVLVGCFVSTAKADNIGLDCKSCQGSIYTLQYALEGSNGNLSTYDIIYTIDTSGYDGGGLLLDDVAFKVSSSTPTNLTIDAAPGGAADWTIVPGGISAAGCNGQGVGFVCAKADSLSFAAMVPNSSSPYVWQFDITLPTGKLLLGNSKSSIKVDYTDSQGKKVGALVSEGITLQPGSPVPEPTCLILLGTGLLGLGALVHWRLEKS